MTEATVTGAIIGDRRSPAAARARISLTIFPASAAIAGRRMSGSMADLTRAVQGLL